MACLECSQLPQSRRRGTAWLGMRGSAWLFIALVTIGGAFAYGCAADDEAPSGKKAKKKASASADDDDATDDKGDDDAPACADSLEPLFDVTFDSTAAVRMRALAAGDGYALAWAAEPYVGSEITMGKRARFGLYDANGAAIAGPTDALAKPSFAPLAIARGDGVTNLLLRARPDFDKGDRKESLYFAAISDAGKLVRAPIALSPPGLLGGAAAFATSLGTVAIWAVPAAAVGTKATLYAQAFAANSTSRGASVTVDDAASTNFAAAVDSATEQIAVTWYDTATWIRFGAPGGFSSNTVKVELPVGKNGANGKALFTTPSGFVLVLVDDGVVTVATLDDHGVASPAKSARIGANSEAPIRFARGEASTFVVWQSNPALTPLGEGDATDDVHAVRVTDLGEAIDARVVGTVRVTQEERAAASNALGVDLGEPVLTDSGNLTLPVTRTTFTGTSVHVASICPGVAPSDAAKSAR